MTKKVILLISIAVNIILAVAFVIELPHVLEELKFEYVEQSRLEPDTIRAYLDRENYGTAASRSRAIRAGADISSADIDQYRLGEYAELLFLKEVFERDDNADSVQKCEERIAQIRKEMPEYETVLDKMDMSAANAVRK